MEKTRAAGRGRSTRLPVRRSPCPVACSLDIFGDRWTLLIVRDLMLGRGRFRDFLASPEGIPTNILAERLERLMQYELIQQIPAADGTKRRAYQLTQKGESLRPVLKAIRDWGLQSCEGAQALLQNDARTAGGET